MSHKSYASYRFYNPALKPTQFKPGKPIPFYGFPPDIGTSYSSFQCDSCGAEAVMAAHHNICPQCHSKTMTAKRKDVKQEEVNELLSSSAYSTITSPCPKCGSEFVTSLANLDGIEAVYCPGCGTKMDEYYSSLKALLEDSKKDVKACLRELRLGDSAIFE